MRQILRGALLLLCLAGMGAGQAGQSQAGERKPAAKKKQAQRHVHKAPAKAEALPKRHAKARSEARIGGALSDEAQALVLQSRAVLIQDQQTGEIIYQKNPGEVVPIASITKLMTAMVVLDAGLDLGETVNIGDEDVDTLKGTRSRLPVGAQLTRGELMLLALMSSENRAAAALSRHYPGGREAFLAAMNRKAQALGLADTRFYDSTGLNSNNVSSAHDLARMVAAAHHYPVIRDYSTRSEHEVHVGRRLLAYNNTNALVKSDAWDIGLSKTGFISEAGKCLVMQASLASRQVVIVLLDSWGKLTRIGDANRIKRWLEHTAATAQRDSRA